MATGNLERDLGAIEVRVQRLESLRQRVFGILPLAVLLVMLMGQWAWLSDRFETMDERLDRVEHGQAEIMRLLQTAR